MPASPKADFNPGARLPPEWVYHNTKSEFLPLIAKEGFSQGTFTPKPYEFTGDVWVAVRKSDLPGPVQEHQYGSDTAIESNWGGDGKAIAPDRVYQVDRRGRVICRLDRYAAKIIPVRDNRGDIHYLSEQQVNDPQKIMLRCHKANGERMDGVNAIIHRANLHNPNATDSRNRLLAKMLAEGYELPDHQFRETETHKRWKLQWEAGWRVYTLNDKGVVVPSWVEKDGKPILETADFNFLWAKPPQQDIQRSVTAGADEDEEEDEGVKV